MAGFEVENGELGEKSAVFSNGECRRIYRGGEGFKRPFTPSPQGESLETENLHKCRSLSRIAETKQPANG